MTNQTNLATLGAEYDADQDYLEALDDNKEALLEHGDAADTTTMTEVRTAQAEDFDMAVDDTVDQVTVTRAKQGDLTKTLRALAYLTWGDDTKTRTDFIHEAMVRGVNKTTAGVCWAAGRLTAQNDDIADQAVAGWLSGGLVTSLQA